MDDELRRLLLSVERPARYLGGEPGQVVKDPAGVEVRFGLCFPDAYEIGMSHLGLKILYGLLNRDDRVWCERAFAPLPDMERAMRRAGRGLGTLESGTPLGRLDVLGFSLQHELCFTNVLLMLDLAGVPLRSADRTLEAPLVVAGGPTATHAEPLAPFVDAFVLGDGELAAGEVARAWVEARRAAASRAEALAEVARHPAVYAPSLARVERDLRSSRLVVVDGPLDEPPRLARSARVADLDAHPFPVDGPVALTEAVFDRAAVEIARGCSGGCRFCQAGMIYRPTRERSVGAVLGCLLGQVAHGGYDEASLASLSTADYSQVGGLLGATARELAARDVALSVSSLRAHGLTPELSEALAVVRTSSLTLAPEAATQRLRDVVNKNVDEDAIFRGALAAITRSRRRLKLYFMIGLPTETDEDVRAIADLAIRLQSALAARRGGRAELTLTVSTFVPKPHTPLQWCEALGPEEVRERQRLLRDLLAPARRRVELRPHDVRLSMLEALLSRGDRSMGDLVEWAYREGARFDGWDDLYDHGAWERALAAWSGDPAVERAAIPIEARLPWDHLDVGPCRAYLAREHRRALAARTTPPCLLPPPEGGPLTCNGCGLECDLELQAAQLARCGAGAEPAGAAPLARRDAREATRLRLVFAKTGPLALLGHLDAMRLLSRLLRRAGVRVAYSRGFHPKPRMAVAAPLPVGMEGLAEVLDLDVEEAPPPAELLAELRRLAPSGLEPRVLRVLEAGEPGAARSVAAADLVVASPELAGDLEEAVAALLARESIRLERPKKGELELRPSLLELAPCTDEALLASLAVSAPALRVRLALGKGSALRAEELVALLGAADPAPRAVRLRLLGDPLPAPLE